MKTKFIILLSFIIFIIITTIVSAKVFILNKPFCIKESTYIYIDDDDTADSVFYKMETNLNPKSMTGFKLLSKIKSYNNIYTGAYKFDSETTTLEAFRRIKAGNQSPVRMIVPSTRTIERLAAIISKQIMADSVSIISILNDSSYIASIGYNKETIPALFIPNTYEVYWNMSADGFIRRMLRENKSFWNKERVEKAKSIGLTPVEVCTLASIVEEETANNVEKPIVAGLYINRLKKGMFLQADPTVKFSLKEFGLKRILFKHLNVDSPYNTYKYQGLPPGPIRIPSIAGINSVLNYSRHNYIYMCAKEDFSGTHNFASTLSEHNINARKYQQALNRKNIK